MCFMWSCSSILITGRIYDWQSMQYPDTLNKSYLINHIVLATLPVYSLLDSIKVVAIFQEQTHCLGSSVLTLSPYICLSFEVNSEPYSSQDSKCSFSNCRYPMDKFPYDVLCWADEPTISLREAYKMKRKHFCISWAPCKTPTRKSLCLLFLNFNYLFTKLNKNR